MGYGPERLEQFPGSKVVRGAYWADISTQLKSEVATLSPQEVIGRARDLKQLAERDLGMLFRVG